MPKNQEFIDALKDPQLANRPNSISALNAILESIASNDDGAFRAAILSHPAVWNGLGTTAPFRVSSADLNDAQFLDRAVSDFALMQRYAAGLRVLYTLKEASEAQLEAIIAANSHTETRKKLFGDDGVSIFGQPQVTIQPASTGAGKWDPATEAVITNPWVDHIKVVARRQLLIKKIVGYRDTNYLRELLVSKNDKDFRNAARAVCEIASGGAHFTDNMSHADLKGAITHAAAKRRVSLVIDASSDEQVTSALVKNILFRASDFKGSIGIDGARDLADSDVDELRGQLGTRYLIATYSSLPARDIKGLEAIASSVNTAALLNTIKGLPENGPYLVHAVTDATFASIRQAAASRALKIRIDTCEDEAALNALIAVKDNKELQQKLETEEAFGFSGVIGKPFREAFTDPHVEDIVALAHIRKNITFLPTTDEKNDRLDVLKLLVSNPSHFAANYLNHLAINQPKEVQDKIKAYFDADVENSYKTCAQALLTYLEQKLPDLTTTDLDNLIHASDVASVITPVNKLLGLSPGDRGLTALIKNYDRNIGKQIRAYAAAESEIRRAKQPIDLRNWATGNKNQTDLLDKINNPNSSVHLDALITTPDFPAKQQQRVQTSLVESLIRNLPSEKIPAVATPASPNVLEILANAADIDQFKAALTTLQVTDHSWVNAKTMEQMQKAACTQLVKLDLNRRLSFFGSLHPRLINLVDSLPLDKQRALLANPKAVVALSEAKEDKEVYRILDGKFVDALIVSALVAENKYLTAMSSIPNSALANVLVTIQPSLNKDQIDQVTGYVLSLNQTNFDYGVEYDTRVKHIIYNIMGLTKPADRVTINTIKGAFNANQIQQSIKNQHTYNQHVLAAYNARPAPNAKYKAIYAMIAALGKTAQLSNAPAPGEVAELRTALAAETYREFLEKINKKPAPSYLAKFDPSLDKQITPKRFAEMKIAGRKQALLDSNSYVAELTVLDRRLTTQTEQFTNTKLSSLSPLKRLATAKPLYWLNPAFQAASKENAKKMGSQLREVSTTCDTMITHLRDQFNQAQQELDSLPSNKDIDDIRPRLSIQDKEEMQEAMTDRRTKITKLQAQIKKELDEYEKLQILFRGEPTAPDNAPLVIRQGILKTLKQAEEGKTDIRIKGSKSYAKDYPNSDRARHFTATWKSEGKPSDDDKNLKLISAVSPDCFDLVGMVEPGHFREYTVIYEKVDKNTGAVTGEEKSSYIEERRAGDLSPIVDSKGVTQYQSAMTLTANKFPQDTGAQVHQVMDMATRMIAARGKPPTPDDPILLKGSLEQVKFAWTALMVIGRNDPNMRFDEKSIIIDNAQFNPEKEFGSVYGFAKGSAYENYFKDHPSVTVLLKNIKKVDELKVDKKSKQTTEKDTTHLTRFYKGKREEIESVEKKNKESDDTIRPAPPV
ncbi:hypothetical protein [Legionella drozanskii]|uniref:Interaptin n=1 Tax=Legionella drozanskii LLAP-1 TaxID=1212489 RepID=A0A0W0SRT4_9GAMM|nr:hypothetical protein [Legionella drozanskii]KTC86030.1 interaptin [Legionella drozanskii LLAP-1]